MTLLMVWAALGLAVVLAAIAAYVVDRRDHRRYLEQRDRFRICQIARCACDRDTHS